MLHQQSASLLETIAGEDPKKANTFRRHEDRAPPHLPLPPTLPYQPTSTPFRRHLQILEESLLSSSAEPSWEIFTALHEDLRRRHLPPDTLRAILAKQVDGISVGGRSQGRQWKKVREVLEILDECGVLGRPEDLERIIIAGINEQGKRTAGKYLKANQVHAVWNSLVAIHAHRLHNISLPARERWLLFRLSSSKNQRVETNRGEIHHDVQSELRAEWRRLASQGFSKGITISRQILQAFAGDYLSHVKDILETLRIIQQNAGMVPLDAVRFVWGNHLEDRITTFEPPDPEVYRFLAETLGTETTTPRSFDALSRDALHHAITQVTGNCEMTALSLYLPLDKVAVVSGPSCSFEEAFHTIRRRIKQLPTQPTESQTPAAVTSLGFGVLLIKDAVDKGVDIPESLVTVISRGFKYLPPRIRTGERYAPRLHSALLLLFQSLRRQDKSLKRWITAWPLMLDTIAGYSTDSNGRNTLTQTMIFYRQMRKSNLSEHLDCLSAFREDVTRKVLDYPWLALELYSDAIASGAEDNPATRAAIVFRIATMNRSSHLRRLRTEVDRHQGRDPNSTVLGILYDAISTCESPEHALLLYELLKDSAAAAKALELLLNKMQEVGDCGQRQRAVSLVEDAYSKGICLSRDGLETLVGLLDGQAQEGDVNLRVAGVEEALRTNTRLFVAQDL